MMKSISVRVEESFMKEAKTVAELEKVDKSSVIREALEKGLAEIKLETAVELFSEGKISTSEAAEIAGLSVGELMDELVKRGIKPAITKEDLKDTLAKALKEFK